MLPESVAADVNTGPGGGGGEQSCWGPIPGVLEMIRYFPPSGKAKGGYPRSGEAISQWLELQVVKVLRLPWTQVELQP